MTIKEEIQLEEYKRTFAEAYKQGFMDAMSVCKIEPQTITMVKDHGRKQALEMIDLYRKLKDEPQTDCTNCDQVGRCERGKAVDCPLTERSE